MLATLAGGRPAGGTASRMLHHTTLSSQTHPPTLTQCRGDSQGHHQRLLLPHRLAAEERQLPHREEPAGEMCIFLSV